METAKDYLESGAWVGRQQAFALVANKCSAAQAQALKEIKQSRVFEKLGITWTEFCQTYVGLCREKADARIRQFDEFGEAYFRLSEIARISPEAFRELKPKVEGDIVSLCDQDIPLTLANASKIRAVIRKLRVQRDEARRLADQREPTGVASLRHDVDVLIEEAQRISYGFRPDGDRSELLELATHAIERWKKFARDYAGAK